MVPTSKLRVCVIGTGSIGMRHIRNLLEIGVSTTVISRSRKQLPPPYDSVRCLGSIEEALNLGPHLAIIATPTSEHARTLSILARHAISTLVEKPICANLADLDNQLSSNSHLFMVAYNYRFHDAVVYLKSQLASGIIGRPLSITSRVGQFLPDWHPGEDYRASYVSRAELGGGVTRTLSHEIDYVDWLISEDPLKIQGMVGKLSDLEVDVDDVSSITIRYPSTLATITLNMVQRFPSRDLTIHGTKASLIWNDMERSIYLQTPSHRELLWEGTGRERDNSFKKEVLAALEHASGAPRPKAFGDPFRTLRLTSLALESASCNRTLSWKSQ